MQDNYNSPMPTANEPAAPAQTQESSNNYVKQMSQASQVLNPALMPNPAGDQVMEESENKAGQPIDSQGKVKKLTFLEKVNKLFGFGEK